MISGYSKHTRIALPSDNDAFIEFGFGDWDYYALENRSSGSALRAAFFSKASAYSRRTLPFEKAKDEFQLRTGASRTYLIEVEQHRAIALLEALETLWNGLDEADEVFQRREALFLRRSNDRYHLFNNSNHKAASWLEALGCEVRGFRMTNNFEVPSAPSTN